MHYYQAPDKSLHALDDPAFEHLLPIGSVEITETQYQAAQPIPTQAQLIAEYQSAVQGVLDAYAVSKRYDSMLSMSTYVISTNAQFKAEATAAVAWRDAVWASAYATLAAVEAGTTAMPIPVTDFLATLPAHP
jgi:hypothetical protein